MAYWLYCQACKQWSKSATPLSDDKTCSFCNSILVKTKQPTRLKSGNVPVEMAKEPESESIMPQTTELSTNPESFDNTDEVQIEKQETLEVSESPLESDALDDSEKPALETDETPEKPELSPTAESFDVSREPIISESSERLEELATEEFIEESVSEITPQAAVASEEAVNLETSEYMEKDELDGALGEIEPSAPHELSGVPSLSITKESETTPELAPDDTIEAEPEVESDLPETLEVPTEEELSAKSEEHLADELLDDPEELAVDEMEEPSDPDYTPGHRMFLEDRRRRRKR